LSLLLETRKASGLTQEEIARRMGKPQSYMSKCQSGERRIDAVELWAICRAMGVPLSEFSKKLEEVLEGW
jgi:transcriptional regulator with XRE-family HTH domain